MKRERGEGDAYIELLILPLRVMAQLTHVDDRIAVLFGMLKSTSNFSGSEVLRSMVADVASSLYHIVPAYRLSESCDSPA
jgi:hypothetical protein